MLLLILNNNERSSKIIFKGKILIMSYIFVSKKLLLKKMTYSPDFLKLFPERQLDSEPMGIWVADLS